MTLEQNATASLYINRELSMLEFNKRVLALAQDSNVPLLERLRFLCITSTNLDEFFEIRVAAIKQRMERGAQVQGPENLPALTIFHELREQLLNFVQQQYDVLNSQIFPELDVAGVRFLRSDSWNDELREWLTEYFRDQVEPVLTPLTFDPSRPFPRILNKSLNFIVRLRGRDAYGRRRHRGVVQAPRSLPRIIRLPERLSKPSCEDFVFLSAIIREHVDELFPGLKVDGCFQFRVTRNSILYVDEEEVNDLVRALEGELEASRYGAAVRLEVGHDCPEDLQEFLLDHFKLTENDMYLVDGMVNLNRLATICDIETHPELLYPPFTQSVPEQIENAPDMFTAMHKKPVLLFHPFHAFSPVVDFIKQAAADSDVLAIKITLYRAGADSPIIDYLVAAARAGKEVTVIIELMARFDEAANISLASRLQEAGAHVVYGLVGYKTHSKMTLVVRREHGKLARYVHLGTGNYHHNTARLYTDYGLFSSDPKLGKDVHEIFMQLTSLTETRKLKLMLTAPFDLQDAIISKINREAEHARNGLPARIVAKVNALEEREVVDALYDASKAGVQIDLIVRGICSLRPGVPGVSENIRVRSIVGRFLEHSRVYYFENGDDCEYFCASADWMERNLKRRNETCFPVTRKSLRKQLQRDLELYLADNTQAWVLKSDGSYERLTPGDDKPVSAQDVFLEELTLAI